MRSPRLIVIAGPTAAGKTPAAVALAEQIPAEIVCADSRTVYRGMDIGTAKPSADERRRVPHHLLDIAGPDEVITLATYQRLAAEAIGSIRERGRVPLLVGGTGLYISAVVDGLSIPPAAPDWAFRMALEAAEREAGPGTLHRRLGEVDPTTAARIHPNNLRRIIRALEVHAQTGIPISALQGGKWEAAPSRNPAPGDALMVALGVDRADLYERIHRRIDRQLESGLVDEVRSLLSAGSDPTLPAMQGLGYKEIVPYVQGRRLLDECRTLLRRNTRRYAKRQLTWFRRDRRYHWLEVGDEAPESVAARVRAMADAEPPQDSNGSGGGRH